MTIFDGLANRTEEIPNRDSLRYARWIYSRHSADHETPVLTCDPREYRVISLVELFPHEDVIYLDISKKQLLNGEGIILQGANLSELKERLERSERELKFASPGAFGLELGELQMFERKLAEIFGDYRRR